MDYNFDYSASLTDPATFWKFFAAYMAVSVIVGLAVYIYSSLAWMAIAKKTNTPNGWLAFIPVANYYLMSQIAGMHWWPILLVIGFIIPILNIFAMLALAVFAIIWTWKAFEKVGRPGWWVLLMLIPIVGWLIFLILLGMAAWGKQEA